MSNFLTGRKQFEDQHFDAYGSSSSRGSDNGSSGIGGGMFRPVMDIVQPPALTKASKISHTRHLTDLLGAANETNPSAGGLSLSLGSHVLVPSDQYRHSSNPFNPDLLTPNYLISTGEEVRETCGNIGGGTDHFHYAYGFTNPSIFASSSSSQYRSYGAESYTAVIGNSRYLKPAQSLLEELVSVCGKMCDGRNEDYVGRLGDGGRIGAMRLSTELKAELCSNGLFSTDKNELQFKIAELIKLLDEVEGRYEVYYHRMEEVVASFEMIAGVGAAKCYTGVALQVMSRHFCNLRDAIISHINVEKRNLLQDLPKISSRLSRLSLFDRETGHGKIMSSCQQQLGIQNLQNQAWRPIRGLPETSVAVLRSWLFQHFLHPYPNESEKLMLASQTGLSKNQVSNWFINARVRLWKPMIEEMYKEEFGDQSSEDSNPSANINDYSSVREGVED